MIAPGSQGGPVPQGDYVAATRQGPVIFTAGMTPRADGVLIRTGRVRADCPVEDYRDAVVQACSNALTAARGMLAEGEELSAILSMTIFIVAEEGFTAHSRIADFASQFLKEQLGQQGVGARCAVGVATLPGGAPVEIQIVASV